ncbi:MAG: hypothetical protein AB7F09_03065 [Parvibaculaceae bacterium]
MLKSGLYALAALLVLMAMPATAADTVRIYKLDGSRQCEEGTGRSLERDVRPLRRLGIPIRAMKKLHHPTMVNIMMCGAQSTRANTYVIGRRDWRRHRARLTGFAAWPR